MKPDDHAQQLSAERVEWLPSSPDEIEVRVFGTWHGPTVPPHVELVAGAARAEALPAPPGRDVPPAWSAAFLVPAEARALIEQGGASLDVGGVLVGLPPGAPGRLGPASPPGGGATVIDHEVLAERRARRAELAEQSAADRASSAEAAAETLRAQLENVEQRLARAASERDALAARVADAERRLRVAEQREEAERRRRGELEEELAAARREAEDELRDLHDRLASAEEVAEALERELAHLRHREEAERAARLRADERLREALVRVAELERGDEVEVLRLEVEQLTARLAEVEAERRRLEQAAGAPPEELEAARAEAEELRRRLAETEAALAEEQRAHASTERARQLAAQRTMEERVAREEAERRLAEAAPQVADAAADAGRSREEDLARQVAALEDELARRAETHARVQAAIDAFREDLVRVRAQVEGAAGGEAARAEIETLAAHGRALEARLREREGELEAARTALAAARESVEGAERVAADLRAQLADERRRHAEAERHLRETFEARVRDLSGEVAAMRERLREVLSAARAAPPPAAEPSGEPAAGPAAAEEAPAAPGPSVPAGDAGPGSVAPAGDAPPKSPAEAGDDTIDAVIAGLRAQVESARAELEAWDEPAEEPAPPPPAPDPETHARLKAIEEEIRAATPRAGAPVPAREIIASLQSAAERLRAAAEEELARADAEEAGADEAPRARDDAPEPQTAAAPSAPAARVEIGASAGPAPETAAAAAPQAPAPQAPAPRVETGAPAEPAPAAQAAETAAPAPVFALEPRPVTFGRRERPWLRTALERLAVDDPARGAELLVALLPAQATLGRSMTYLLTAPTLGAVKVTLGPGTAIVERAPVEPVADARVSGSIASLAPLAAGGAPWRLKDVRVEGARRQIRRLVRARRRPLGLDEVALVTPAPSPGVLLAALAAAVDPAWTAGHRFGVTYEIDGAGRWTVLADDGKPLRVVEDGGEHPHAAVVTLTPGALLPVLQGAAVPRVERAVAAGDRRAVDVLHGWFDRARGAVSR